MKNKINILKTFNTSAVLKTAGITIAVVVIAAIVIRLLIPSFHSLMPRETFDSAEAPGMGGSYDGGIDFPQEFAGYGGAKTGLSVRNIMPQPPMIGGTTGDTAEAFEVTEYTSTIRTGALSKTCAVFTELKSRSHVIFESAQESDTACRYTFKVKKDAVAEVVAIIEELNPDEFSEHSYTIKRLVDDYTSQVEILERKLATIEDTLENAVTAYDDITELATRTQDVESLAEIITSKINIIERLTQERIAVSDQLDYLSRAKAEELDRLEYTYFHVNVFESAYINTDVLRNSWRAAIQEFVRDSNKVVQDLTINLVSALFVILQYAIYILILVVLAKYGWKLVRAIWLK